LDDFLKTLIIYSTLPINIIHLLLYFRLRLERPLMLSLGFLLLFLPLLPLSLLSWELLPGWKWPVTVLLYQLFTAWILRLFVLERTFSSILFGILWVGAFSHLAMTLIYSVLFSALGKAADWTSYYLVRLIYACLCLILFPIFHRYVRPYFVRLLDTIENERWFLVNLTPIMLYVMTYMELMVSFNYYNGFIMMLGLLLTAAYVGFFVLIYNMAVSRDMNSFLAHQLNMSQQFAGMLDRYDLELSRKENALRIMRHDFRHHIARLDALAQTGDTEAIRLCLGDLCEISAEFDLGAYSDDRVVNAVVSHHFSLASRGGARCQANVSLSPALPLSDAELAVMIGNALENCAKAVTPLGQWGRISFNAKPVKDRMVFKFQNNYVEDCYRRGSGLGLRSIKILCDRHGGIMESKEVNGQFILTVILPLNDSGL